MDQLGYVLRLKSWNNMSESLNNWLTYYFFLKLFTKFQCFIVTNAKLFKTKSSTTVKCCKLSQFSFSFVQYGGGGLVAKSCPTLLTLWTVACQAPLSMGFSRQEYWSGLPFPPPTGEEGRVITCNSRKNEVPGPKQKWLSVVNVSDGESKVQCCKK